MILTELRRWMFCLVLLWSGVAGAQQVDLAVEASYSIPGVTYAGTTFSWSFEIRKVDGTSTDAVFPTGATVLQVDLPDGMVASSVRLGSGALFDGSLDCAQSGSQILCLSVNTFKLLEATSRLSVGANFAIDAPGDYAIPAAGGVCRVDPGGVVDEGGGDGVTTNDCSGQLGPVTVLPLPETQDDWLAVTERDNIARAYDHGAFDVVNAVPVGIQDGSPVHFLSDVVRHPLTQAMYVLYHPYQSDRHWLGLWEPTNGIQAIGPTGAGFHDAAFAPDGSLYGIGREGILFAIEPTTGMATGLCTPNQPAFTAKSGLAWHPTAGLVQVTPGSLLEIETANLPKASPADPCVVSEVAVSPSLGTIHTAAVAGGQIYVASAQNRLILMGLEGAQANLGPIGVLADGLLPNAPALPESQPVCPAPFYTVSNAYPFLSLLFAVDPDGGDATFVQTMGTHNVQSMDWDNRPGLLRAQARDALTGAAEILSVDPCSGASMSIGLSVSGAFAGLDITPDGTVWLYNSGLSQVDPDTGMVVPVPGTNAYSSAFAIRGDEVFLDPDDYPETLSLHVRSLSNWAGDTFVPFPLSYGPGAELGSASRLIYDLDVSQFSGQLYGLLSRDSESWGDLDALAVPNALVTISDSGEVIGIMDLPSTSETVAGTHPMILSDGFEDPPE
jgi:hypothetical protein